MHYYLRDVSGRECAYFGYAIMEERMIDFRVDSIVPCLKNVDTGDLYDTEVIRIGRKSVLTKYNKRNGWHVSWAELARDSEIYALVLKGTNDVQGLIALQYDPDARAVYVRWACTAPQNNIWQYGEQRFVGVGGHLLAIASELSVRHGYEGFLYADAADRELYMYYIERFGAMPLPPMNNPYRFMLTGASTAYLREVYTYEWTDDVI